MPSEAQKKAGNYAKWHIRVAGLPISIESRKGSIRSGTDASGQPWSVVMPAHYGYVRRTVGADGDQVDVFVGPNRDSEFVVIANCHDAIGGQLDEHKVFIGFNSLAQVKATYRAAYRGKFVPRAVFKPTSMQRFKEWLKSGRTWGAFHFDRRINLIHGLTALASNVKPIEFRQPDRNDESPARKVARVVTPLAVTGGALYLWHKNRPKVPVPVQAAPAASPAKPSPPVKSAAPVRAVVRTSPVLAYPVKRKLVTNKLAALHARLVLFNERDETNAYRYGASGSLLTQYRKARRAVPVIRRTTQAAGDIADIASGRKVKDPFYKKTWFKSAVLASAIAGVPTLARKLNKYHHSDLKRPGSVTGARKAVLDIARRKVPRFVAGPHGEPFFSARTKPIELGVLDIFKRRPVTPPTPSKGEAMKALMQKLERFNKRTANFQPRGFIPKPRATMFDMDAELRGWDVRDPRGRSARVFAPGARRRERREKTSLEKVSTIRAIRNAAIAGTVAGGLGTLYYRNKFKKAAGTKRATKPSGGGEVVAVNFARKDSPALHRVIDATRKSVSVPDLDTPGHQAVRVVMQNPRARTGILRVIGAGGLAAGGALAGMAVKKPRLGAALGGLGAGLYLR